MATTFMLDQPAELRKAAKLLSMSADAMAKARRAAMAADPPTITPGEFEVSILHENFMRNAVTSILRTAIDGAIKGVQGSQADLEQAIEEANEKIEKLNDIKKAFSVFASVIGLAQAIVAGSPVGILDAFGALKEAAA